MFEKFKDPQMHEIIGRSLINVLKLGITAVLFVTLQKAFYSTSNDLIDTADQGLTKLMEPN